MALFLLNGIILGLSAGFAPGPLLALVISETLRHDLQAGIKVAIAPLITDLPIVLFSLFILYKLSSFDIILGFISLVGASFVLYLGISGFSAKPEHIEETVTKPQSLKRGILVNFFSPHPYLFWITVGGPLFQKAGSVGLPAQTVFLASFYALLVGSKIVLAIICTHSKKFLKGKIYLNILRSLSVILCLFSFMLFYEAIILFSG